VARGVFGAPTFFVDGAMYWGQDRLDFVKEELLK
jgi:2-hydroxychromene-2-carboxylate isomerase